MIQEGLRLTKEKILRLAIDYLIKNNYPIVQNTGDVELPEEDNDPEQFLKENNLASVSFRSKHFDDPYEEYPCDPGVYIVYVDLATGEVHMPRHM